MTGEHNKPSDDTAKKATSKANEKTSAATDNSENSTIANNALDASTSKGDLEVKDGKTTSTKSKKTKDMDMTLKKDSAKGTVSKKAENNAKKITAALSPKPATSDKPEIPTNQQKTSKISIIALIILLLLIIGLAVSASYGLRFWTDYSTKQEQRLAAIESISNAQLIKIEALSQEQARKNSDQIDFFASQRLLVENSTVGAQALLHSADSILLSIDDPELMPVRSAIAAEMISLKLAKAIDRPGIYLQLSALKDEVQALPLIPHRPKSKSISAEILLRDNEPKQWYSPMVSSINTVIVKLKGFVQIRQHDQAPDLLISEQQQLQIINNLMLMLEQAQYSLLHEEELIYQASLQKAKKWWRSYYSHYSEYEVINHELNKLLNKEITQTIPTINRSTKLLTDYIDRFHKLNVDNTNTSNEFAPAAPSPSADAKTQEKAL